ncbi:hypothetical protein AAFC00_004362 [Neodothiora populina]|uniref:Alpha-L-rhamnosidase six-hairpin glycosidase domain-containing protein n=1 Tax=Neodothiora populina TaxID=2781224 RepID=A0ABR3PJU1_9PEZI
MFGRSSAAIAVFSLLWSIHHVQATQYSEYILAPKERVLAPVSVHRANGSVSNAAGVTESGSGNIVFSSVSAVTFDYSKNIGGLVSFVVDQVSGPGQFIGISYSESSMWITPDGSDATQNTAIDETLWFEITGPGNYTVDEKHDRGGFRYLNIYHNTTGNISLSEVTTYYTAMPHYAGDAMGNYTGYFHSNDEKLNRVWYAAAYTCQLCTIPSTHGNSLVDLAATDPDVPTFWYSNSTLTNGISALVDGAKRDKLIWPGDFSISVPGVFLSTNDAVTIKLSLDQLFADQKPTGQLPYYAQPVLAIPQNDFLEFGRTVWSFTYHLYSILGLNIYYTYTSDLAYLQENWNRVELALNYSLSFIDETGLANVTASADWLRVGMGGHNIEANSILAYTLDTAIILAQKLNQTAHVSKWTNTSSTIKSAANALLWDSASNLYFDNETTTLHPQDGNVWSILSGVASSSRARDVSTALVNRWTPYGPPAPEAGVTVSPFISSFELQAHFIAATTPSTNSTNSNNTNPATLALDLIRLMWADFMLDDPRMTNSTFNEGYSVTGALSYPAYADDARISHAHGWSTGPIIALTNYVAGLHILGDGKWNVRPQPGDLESIEAGFKIAEGKYWAEYRSANTTTPRSATGGFVYEFGTPEGTSGLLTIDIPTSCADARVEVSSKGTKDKRHGKSGSDDSGRHVYGGGHHGGAANGTIVLDNLEGGEYVVHVSCS